MNDPSKSLPSLILVGARVAGTIAILGVALLWAMMSGMEPADVADPPAGLALSAALIPPLALLGAFVAAIAVGIAERAR